MLLKAERLKKIIDKIAEENTVMLDSLSQSLNVSTDTIRRDIKELSDRGLLEAVRGGAIGKSVALPGYKERQSINTELKNIIGKKALEFLTPQQVIFIDAGTTTTAAVMAMPKDIQLTVVTNSFPVVHLLEDYVNVEVFFIGGRLDKGSFSTIGIKTIETIRDFRVDLCLLGICSIDVRTGITGANYEESLIKKTLVETSKFTIALSTYDKIGHSDPYYICAANAIDVFITEKDPSESDLADFKVAGIKLK